MVERLLRRNSSARLLSVVLAVVLWFYVVAEQNPTMSRSFEVPVQVRSLDADLAVVSVDPATVTVTVEGPRQLVNNLETGDFIATINLGDAVAGPVVASVRVAAPNPVQLVEVNPGQVITLVEPLDEAVFPVELAVTGRVSPNYRLGEPRVTPREVIVRGGTSVVARIERVVSNVDVGGAEGTLRRDLPLYAIDASGRQVTDVRLVPSRVSVTVPVRQLPPLATLPVRVDVQGELPEGVALAGTVVAVPDFVVVRASSETLNGVDHVMTEPLDLSAVRQPSEVELGLQIPEGVELVGPERVRVYVPVRPAAAAE